MITLDTLRPENVAGEKFDQLYRIYEEALPAAERKPAAALRAMLAAGRHAFIIACAQDAVKGFAIVYRAPHLGFALLEYMATRADARAQGIGALLFKGIGALTGDAPLLIEIESPAEAADNSQQRRKRIAFYERHGARLLENFPYICPLPGQLPDMILMLRMPTTVRVIAIDVLQRWIKDIYVTVYGCSAEDQRITAMFETKSDVLLLRPLMRSAPQ